MRTVTGTSSVARRPSSSSFHPSGWAALGVSLAVLVAAVVGLFTAPETASALVYSYSPRAGDTRVYAMSMGVTLTPQNMPDAPQSITETMKARMTMKVVKVRPDESFDLEMRISDLRISGDAGAASMDDVLNQPVKMHVSKSGEVLSVDGPSFAGFDPTKVFGATGSQGSTMGTNLFPVFPSDEIGPGDTWAEEHDYPMPFGDDKVHMTIKGKHLGFVESSYGRAARMNVKMNSLLDFAFSFADIIGAIGEAVPSEEIPAEVKQVRMVMDGSMRADMTAQVVPSTGDLVKMVTLMKMNVAMGFENVPAEMRAELPPSIRFVGNLVMKLDRIS